jgi:hypothetical protein
VFQVVSNDAAHITADAHRPGAMNSLYGMPLMLARYVPRPNPRETR